MSHLHFIINPTAGGGRSWAKWCDLENTLKQQSINFKSHLTKHHGHATEITRDILNQEKAPIVVACGGDGTNNEVLNGFFDNHALINPAAVLSILPMGSGNDFARTLNIPSSIAGRVEMFKKQNKIAIKVGKVSFQMENHKPNSRYFLNACTLGLTSLAVKAVNHSKKPFGAKIAYLANALISIVSYQALPIKVFSNNALIFDAPFTNLVIANGKFFGCGIKIAPQSEVTNRNFDVLLLPKLKKIALFSKFFKVLKATHLSDPSIHFEKAASISAESPANQDIYIDLDGEVVGTLPMQCESHSELINIIIP